MSDTYALLEDGEVMLSECICLCDDGDEVDACAETLHHLDIKRSKTTYISLNQRISYEKTRG